ncbi:MAG: ATP-binding cassette domain-containing protein [Candidatus Kaiserbacteria bacterium]|nr:ATP-binding cassette domain-containing protein [Candidatus Kaiserbacteria bacterium]
MDTIISFDKAAKRYGDSVAVHDVSFGVGYDEFVTLVGHSGSGKSTLFKLILGEEDPHTGSVCRAGIDIADMSERELLEHRRNTGVIFQDFRLLSKKTVFENIAFAMEALGYEEDKIESDVPYALELVDLQKKAWSFPQELSGGEQQRVAIARAIVSQPELLLADEPTGNLDPVNSHEVISILKQVNKIGTTVILTTHDKSVVNKVKGRVITLVNGEVAMDDLKGKYIL